MKADREIPFIFGIRGILSLYVMLFHLNYILLASLPFAPPRLYVAISDIFRYGDFRVATFFVVSGYLLTIPVARTAAWKLSKGSLAFLKRRSQRLLLPYYAGFGLSVVLWLAWLFVIGRPIDMRELTHGVVSHVLLIHNLLPNDFLLINDALWNVALEFQVYLLFAFVMLPIMRRYGPWTQFALMLVLSLAPHFLFHGFLDWTRPWFVALFSFGVATMAISTKSRPSLRAFETRIPWGTIWVVATALVPFAVWQSGIDTPYGAGIVQNLLLGLAVAAFFTFTRLGMPGPFGGLARRTIALLDVKPLRRVGVYSYSLFLVHYPLLRLLCAIGARFTHSFYVLGTLALTIFVPLTLFVAYRFHLAFERPFQIVRGNPVDQEIAAERTHAPAQQPARRGGTVDGAMPSEA